MELIRYPSAEEVLKGIATLFVRTIGECIADRGTCNVLLSGGNTPKNLYSLLASPEYSAAVDWQRVYLFLEDERYVPADHPDNNGRMVRTQLTRTAGIPEANLFLFDTSLPPAAAAEDYEQRMRAHFAAGPFVFDFVLLGLGDNAHTASLFPQSRILDEHEAGVRAVYVDEVNAYRLTVTAAVINAAKLVAFLVVGASKAIAVKNVISGIRDVQSFPAQLIAPAAGKLYWFLDEPAASLL